MREFKYADKEESTAVDFDLSRLPEQHHEWRQEGNQPLLKCAIHNHTAILPPDVHAVPDANGEMTLKKM